MNKPKARQLRAEKLQEWACATICKYRAMGTDPLLLEVNYCPGCWLKQEADQVRTAMTEIRELSECGSY